jgi:hypothetical protein
MKLIPIEKRPGIRCHFCGETRSVKYVVEISDPVVSNKPVAVYCCNKCALGFCSANEKIYHE